jgi:hypothetical protein
MLNPVRENDAFASFPEEIRVLSVAPTVAHLLRMCELIN